jgi:hypothetical protein
MNGYIVAFGRFADIQDPGELAMRTKNQSLGAAHSGVGVGDVRGPTKGENTVLGFAGYREFQNKVL